MQVTRLQHARDLDHVVESIVALAPDAGDETVHLGLPGGAAHLLIRAAPDRRADYEIHVVGVRSRARRKRFAGEPGILVRFQPGAAQRVLGIPLSELADRIVPIEQLWGETGARLRVALAGVDDPQRRADLVEHAVRARAERSDDRTASAAAIVGHAARWLEQRRELPTVGELAAALGVGERRLHRAFCDAAGVAPKLYVRAVRLRRAIALAGRASWAAVAVDAGYYDQAHMIDDFHRLVGATPTALATELARCAVG